MDTFLPMYDDAHSHAYVKAEIPKLGISEEAYPSLPNANLIRQIRLPHLTKAWSYRFSAERSVLTTTPGWQANIPHKQTS